MVMTISMAILKAMAMTMSMAILKAMAVLKVMAVTMAVFKAMAILKAMAMVGVRGFRSREYLSAPVRVGWLGTRFCRRVLLLLSSFFLSSLPEDFSENCVSLR